jgi:glycosyltransferase involved in cell wall biosynthesis
MDEALASIESINANYEHHRKGASDIAREYFSHEVVLTELLSELGLARRPGRTRNHAAEDLCVNLVGDAGGYTGMSATVERYAQALETTGAKIRMIDPRKSQSTPEVRAGTLEINLICCEIASYFSVRSSLGEDFFRNRYNIGVWLWEAPNFPAEWFDRFAYHDELWAPSSFIATALSPVSPVPVVRMPYVLEPKMFGSRLEGRRRLALDDDEFVYLFAFNFHSRFQRKNPMAVIKAFKQAFDSNERARLIIKCANAGFSRDHFVEMQRQAEGHHISIYDGAWSDQEMSDLLAASDCYVSLHRAEGVGLTISDAMAAGKPVIATGWSGNMDYMNVANSFPVRYRPAELDRNVAHYRAGETWAEPSIEHAAEILRYVYEHREEAAMRGAVARNDIRCGYSSNAIGRLIARRFGVISKRLEFELLRESIAKPIADVDRLLEAFSDLDEYLPEHHFRYEQLKQRLRDVIASRVPRTATLVVVSKGDEDLLKLDGCRSWHFPLQGDLTYAGYYPADSNEAIQQLEAVRAQGGDFLLFPKTALWWLDHYPEFRQHLLDRYRLAHRDDSCVMFELRVSA